jgi:hypothetical protein
VVAAIGFEVAVDEGQHLVPGVQHLTRGQGQRRGGVRGHDIGVHAVEDHVDHLPQRRRVGRGLPFGRRQPAVGMQQRLAQMRGAPLRDHHLVKAGRVEFGVEADVGAAAAIVELGIDQQFRLGPDIFQE